MTKREYVIRQIAKTNKKNYENYVVTRIYHLLNRIDVKFVTQQYVNRPEGHALTDMYFPQIKLHVEIDEPFHKKQIGLDIHRETDIIQATDQHISRIKITDDLSGISSYRATINGKFILMEYDYKKDVLTYDFNDQIISEVENNLKLIVIDNVGNNTTFESTFFRK